MGLTSYLTDAATMTSFRRMATYFFWGNNPVAATARGLYALKMKLGQGQIWKQGKEFIRIVRLERLEVEYKSLLNLTNKKGTLHTTSKKDFCRLLKGATLLTSKETPLPEQVAE
jgi:hypothetical protein